MNTVIDSEDKKKQMKNELLHNCVPSASILCGQAPCRDLDLTLAPPAWPSDSLQSRQQIEIPEMTPPMILVISTLFQTLPLVHA